MADKTIGGPSTSTSTPLITTTVIDPINDVLPLYSSTVGDARGISPYNAMVAPFVPTTIKTTDYTALPADFIPVDTTNGPVAITLPVTPPDRTRIAVKLIASSNANIVTLQAGGGSVFNKSGGSSSLTLTLLNQSIIVQYTTSSSLWYVQADNLPLSQLDARYQSSSTSVASVNGRVGTVVGLAENNTVIHLTGNEIIAGIKTFSASPVISQITDTNGNIALGMIATANAVNYLSTTNSATTGAVTIAPAGADTAIGLLVRSKGTGNIRITPGSDSTAAVKITNANNTAAAMTFDTSNIRLGINTGTPTSTFHNAGSMTVSRTAVADVSYTILGTDYLIAYTSLSAGRTITLPTAQLISGRTYIIKDETGTAGTNIITIATTTSQTIDGTPTKTITANYGSLKIYSNGTNWFTVS